MRTIIALLLLLTLSCSSTYQNVNSPGNVNTSVIDFTKYTDQGFNISTAPPTGQYKSVGLISLTVQPEITELKTFQMSDFNQLIYKDDKVYTQQRNWYTDASANRKYTVYLVEFIDPVSVIDLLVEKAKSMDANSVYYFEYGATPKKVGDLNVIELSASGIAVKE